MAESLESFQCPIFIVGYPRSGSTLLQSMLATQPGLVSLPETHFFSSLRRVRGGRWADVIDYDVLPAVLRAVEEDTGLQIDLKGLVIPEGSSLSVKTLFEEIIRGLLSETDIERLQGCRWIEKTPGHVYHMHEIAAIYPGAQFVSIIRNPLAAVPSRQLMLPADRQLSLEQLAERWGKTCDVLERARFTLEGRLYSVTYEDLVANTTRVISGICRFLQVPFCEDSLGKYRKAAEGLAYPWEMWKKPVLSGPIQDGNIERMRTIKVGDVLRVQHVVGWRMVQLGYPIMYPRLQRLFNAWRRLCRR
jgi:hypothetical protein